MSEQIRKHLEQIFEPENVLSDPVHLLAYMTDASQVKGNAIYVVFPKETEQLRRLVIFAARRSLALVPRGGGTGLVGGVVPDDAIIVDLSRMTRISEFDKDNKTIQVEPGVILEKLNNYLKNFGLFFPVVPSSHGVATLGGMIATNAVGSRAIRYGKTSDNVLEVKLLDAKGEIHTITDTSVFGSEGTLGFMIGMKLHLEPLPVERSLSVFEIDTLDEVMETLANLRDNPHITAIEFIDRKSSKLVDLSERYHLIIEFDDLSGDMKDEREIEEVWEMREGYRTLYGEQGLDIIEDPWIPEEKLKEFIEWCNTNDIPCFGHLGVGIMHLHFNIQQKGLIEKMFNLVNNLGGNVSGEHGIGILKKSFLDRSVKSKFNALKERYDPHNIMNPGKVVGSWNKKLDWWKNEGD